MAEEEKEETQENSFDISEIQNFIKSQIEEQVKSFKPEVPEHNRLSEQDLARQQLKQQLDPFIRPDLDEAKLVANDAKDYVDFYQNNDEALEYRNQVEEIFQQELKSGRPTPRKSILNYILGKEYQEKKEEFIEKYNQKKQRQLERAQAAGDISGTGLSRDMINSLDEFEKMPLEDMEKVLDGITF